MSFLNLNEPNSTPTIETGTISGLNLGQPHKVILFNDDHHSMDEVVSQIMKATGYAPQTAFQVMMEAHKTGRAVVWTGHKERCEHIADVLEEIRLGTKVEPA